ncbi:LRR repeats [Cryptosporidium sp. chipmunk genotype I]|uniref:LRR repeats n=1 Tax=Cryptosporidium sp. chipmunk genotype I TaxID=1280935 RepID=UPI003519F3DA|nr:LRR repeats [Cryptosporidium sp. chipmunk genotype I]
MKIKLGDRVSHLEDERIGTVCSISFTENGEELFGVIWDLDQNCNLLNLGIKNISSNINKNDLEKKPEIHKTNELSSGISFQEAIRDRYLCDEEVEYFVGLKKAQEYCKKISTLSLERMKVFKCACKELIGSLEPLENLTLCYNNINSLCLNNNLLSNWNSLFCILSHLPKLECLMINGNRLKEISYNRFQFNSIKVISMSKTFVEFEQLMLLFRKDSVLPNVNYINLSSNKYTLVSMNYSNQTIQRLDLSLNLLSDWNMIENILTYLSGLKSLNISYNYFLKLPILKINTNTNIEFPSILELNLDNCGIIELGTIVYLRKVFPNLEHLSLRSNKIMDNTQIDLRSIIISILPNIKTFNKSIISEQDIISYQRYYISQYTVLKNNILKEIDPNGDIFCEFVMKNNILIHQDPMPDTDNVSRDEKYLDISFIPQFKCRIDCNPTRIKINKNMAVSDVKVLIWKIYKIKENESLEYIFVSNKTKIKIEGYSDSHSLADLGIEKNGKIYIQDL